MAANKVMLNTSSGALILGRGIQSSDRIYKGLLERCVSRGEGSSLLRIRSALKTWQLWSGLSSYCLNTFANQVQVDGPITAHSDVKGRQLLDCSYFGFHLLCASTTQTHHTQRALHRPPGEVAGLSASHVTPAPGNGKAVWKQAQGSGTN